MPACTSTMEDLLSWMKSVDTTWSSVTPKMPCKKQGCTCLSSIWFAWWPAQNTGRSPAIGTEEQVVSGQAAERQDQQPFTHCRSSTDDTRHHRRENRSCNPSRVGKRLRVHSVLQLYMWVSNNSSCELESPRVIDLEGPSSPHVCSRGGRGGGTAARRQQEE